MSSISYKFFCSGLPYKGYIQQRDEMRDQLTLLYTYKSLVQYWTVIITKAIDMCVVWYYINERAHFITECAVTQKRWEDEFAALKNEGGDKQSVMLLSRTTGAMHCDVLFHASSPAMKLNRKHVLCAATIVCLVLNEFVIFQFICEKALLSL